MLFGRGEAWLAQKLVGCSLLALVLYLECMHASGATAAAEESRR